MTEEEFIAGWNAGKRRVRGLPDGDYEDGTVLSLGFEVGKVPLENGMIVFEVDPEYLESAEDDGLRECGVEQIELLE